MTGPLTGITVLDMSQLLPGPYATRLLADLGARVVKIEPPSGDPLRQVPPHDSEGRSLLFEAVNRGKEGVVLDLKEASGREALQALVGGADCLVESFRPGVAARLGAGYEELTSLHPGLVYCSITGYGQEGSWAGRPGHDVNFLALAGILGATGTRTGEPALPGVPFADMAGGSLTPVVGILAALFERGRTGRGCHLDVSMTEAVAALAVVPWVHCAGTGVEGQPGSLPLTGLLPCYRLYETADGRHLAVGALEPKFWLPLVEHLGLPERAGDAYSPDPDAHAAFEAVFRQHTLEEWVERLDPLGTCVTPVLLPVEACDAPPLKGRDFGSPPGARDAHAPGFPYRVDGVRPRAERPAPTLGQDTEAVLGSVGL